MTKAVLFDMDGVLAFTEQFYNQRRVDYLVGQGFTFNEIPDFSGFNEDAIWKALIPDDPARRRCLHEGYRAYSDKYPTPWAQVANPLVSQTFEGLHHQGIRIAICSSSYRELIDGFMDTLLVRDLVDFSVSGYECAAFKPSPEVYLRAMGALDVGPDEAIVVEDSPTGIEAGRRSGALVCALRPQAGVILDQSGADMVIDSLSDVVALCQSTWS